MGKKKQALSHEEIWDDSALVQSWDDALEEYNLYHSIHARGEKVEDVLKQLEEEEFAPADPASGQLEDELAQGEIIQEAKQDEIMEDGEVDEDPSKRSSATSTLNIEAAGPSLAQEPSQTASIAHGDQAASHRPPPIPPTLVGGVHDDALKNLMMSWYYAGYYTGLYEGQQQGRHQEGKKSSD